MKISTKSVIALHKGEGWKHIQLYDVTHLQKSWRRGNKEYKVNVYFGKLGDENATPVVIMNVYEQGAGVKEVVDDNCDVWKSFFTSTNKEEGNCYYKYLRKHGFEHVAN